MSLPKWQWHYAWLAVICLLLSGCGGNPSKPGLAPDNASALQSWTLSGKLGLRSDQGAKSASLHWRQQQQDFDIHLSGPLGQGRIQIHGNANRVTLEQAGHPPQTASSPEQLIAEQTGWPIPVSDFIYWVRALPAPTAPYHSENDPQQRLFNLQQSGWSLTYMRYQTFDNLVLPSKIVAQRDDLRLTFIIKDWQWSSGDEQTPKQTAKL